MGLLRRKSEPRPPDEGAGEPGAAAPVPASPFRSVGALTTAALAGTVMIAMLAVLFLAAPPRESRRTAERSSSAGPRGISSTEIVFGMVAPFRGANRELGSDMRAGIEAAFADVNAGGGVHGRKLALVAVDDGYEPSRTLPIVKRLVEHDGVFAVVGNVGTPTAAVALPYCMEQKVLFLGALSGSELLRNDPPDRYVFNFRPSYAEETAAAVRYLVDVRRISPARIAVLAQDDGFGESGWAGAAAELQRRGADPSRIVRVGYKRNTSDVTEAVATVAKRAADLDAIVMVATYKAAATFIRRLRDAGLALLTTNVSPVNANALAEELITSGMRYADGVVVTQVVPLPTSRAPGVVRFRESLERYAPGERAGFLTLEGWIVGQLVVEGLRRAGAEPDTEKLVAALESIRGLDLGIGATISFGPHRHQASRKVWGTVLQRDGSWKQIVLE